MYDYKKEDKASLKVTKILGNLESPGPKSTMILSQNV